MTLAGAVAALLITFVLLVGIEWDNKTYGELEIKK